MRRLGAVLGVLAVVLAAPAAGSASSALRIHLGDRVVLEGHTGSRPGASTRALGRVFLTASWNGDQRYVVASRRTDAGGRFRFVFAPTRRGRYEVRILTPDTLRSNYTVYVA